jgi:PRTRC genetic system protein A
MNAADMVLQRSFPTVMVPRGEPVVPMVSVGERLLIAQNGVFLEIKRTWISMVRRIADFSVQTAIPYGDVVERTERICGHIPTTLVGDFVSMARAAHPMETGAWIVWSASTRQFRLVSVKILSHTAGSLNYERPELGPDEVLVVDCHSHGRHKAYFSVTDDEDDKHDIKFALVIGNCSSPVPSFALRLCAKGVFEDVEHVSAAWYGLSMVKEAV